MGRRGWAVSLRRAAACVAAELTILCGPAQGRPAPVDPAPARCEPSTFRYEEDCSGLRDAASGGLETLRYLPLSDEGDWWLQLGGQYRYRLETLDHPNYGLGGAQGYSSHGHRVFVDGEVRSRGGAIVFIELGAAAESGRLPAERSFDRGAIDILQAFIELPADIGSWHAGLRLGRQELDSGGNRLLAVRDVSNFRRTFDMALVSLTDGTSEIKAFGGRPVVNFGGSFDDHWSPTERLAGLTAAVRLDQPGLRSTIGGFFFDRTVNKRLGPSVVAEERRRTLGLRSTVGNSEWDGALQASWQWGKQGEKSIRAYGVAGELGRRWPDMFGAPRVGVSFGWASGDSDGKRGAIGTFDVLYPNLDYFTDAPLSYPGNTTDVRPTLRWSPLHHVVLQAGADWIFRIEQADAVYAPPGVVLVPGGRGPSGRVVTLTDVRASWHFLDYWDLTLSGVHGAAGPVVTAVGGRNATFFLFQLVAKL